MQRVFLWIMIFSLTAAAALAIVAVLVEDLGDTGTKVLVTSLLVGGFSVVCLGCAFVLGRRKAVPLMWIGIGTSLGALSIWVLWTWAEGWRWSDPWDEVTMKTGGSLTTVCLWAAHIGLLGLPVVQNRRSRMVQKATFICATVLAASIILLLWAEIDEDGYFKWITVLSILSACGTVVVPILAIIERLRQRELGDDGSSLARNITVQLTCPRCRMQQALPAGRSKCEKCGLRIELAFDEPRCMCGYLLFDLESDRCPECGRPIADEDRWKRPADPSTTHRGQSPFTGL